MVVYRCKYRSAMVTLRPIIWPVDIRLVYHWAVIAFCYCTFCWHTTSYILVYLIVINGSEMKVFIFAYKFHCLCYVTITYLHRRWKRLRWWLCSNHVRTYKWKYYYDNTRRYKFYFLHNHSLLFMYINPFGIMSNHER